MNLIQTVCLLLWARKHMTSADWRRPGTSASSPPVRIVLSSVEESCYCCPEGRQWGGWRRLSSVVTKPLSGSSHVIHTCRCIHLSAELVNTWAAGVSRVRRETQLRSMEEPDGREKKRKHQTCAAKLETKGAGSTERGVEFTPAHVSVCQFQSQVIFSLWILGLVHTYLVVFTKTAFSSQFDLSFENICSPAAMRTRGVRMGFPVFYYLHIPM